MKNTVGKNIAKLRKDRRMSQEQLAGMLHVTRQAVSNWETGRTQPDLEMLEALAGAFGTDILVVIYGQQPAREQDALTAQNRRLHMYKALIGAVLTLTVALFLSRISGHLEQLRIKTYNAVPYMMFHVFIMPLTSTMAAVSLMHGLNIPGSVRISGTGVRKRLLILGGIMTAVYVFCILWIFVPWLLPGNVPIWIWSLAMSAFPRILFFALGLLLYLGLDL